MRGGWDRPALGAMAIAAVVLAGWARLSLERTRPADERFAEMIYMPGPEAARFLVSGFEAAASDGLWIRGLLYFSDNLRAESRGDREAKFRYLFDLFDLITDLNPRFAQAYLTGSLFLSARVDEQRVAGGIKLLEKGLAICQADARAGRPWSPDVRWNFHTLLADVHDIQVQSLARQRGDLAAAAAARARAREEYALAAASPGCPELVIDAWQNYNATSREGVSLADRYQMAIANYTGLLADLRKRGDKDLSAAIGERLAGMEERRDRLNAMHELEKAIGQASAGYAAAHGGQRPRALEDFVRDPDAFIAQLPTQRQKVFDYRPDTLLLMPDGTAKSFLLAFLEANNQMDFLQDRLDEEARSNPNDPPSSLDDLVERGVMKQVPGHPLAALGYGYRFAAEKGLEEVEPENPPLPLSFLDPQPHEGSGAPAAPAGDGKAPATPPSAPGVESAPAAPPPAAAGPGEPAAAKP